MHQSIRLNRSTHKQPSARRALLVLVVITLLTAVQSSPVLAQASPEATVYTDRAVLAYDAKRYDEALQELERALTLDPNSVDALYYKGLVLIALKRVSEAQTALEKARNLRPGDIDVAFQLGVLFFNQKAYDKAEPLFQQVHSAEPNRPNIGYYLGFIEYRRKNYREALDFFRTAVPSDDNFAQLTRFYAGLAVGALGYVRQAREEIEEALRLKPTSPLAKPGRRFGEVLQKKEEEERFFQGEMRLGVFFDTNVPVVPNSSSDLTAAVIRAGKDRQKSVGQLASLDFSYTWLKTAPSNPWGEWQGTASYRFFQTYNNRLPKFNTQSQTPTVGIVNQGTFKNQYGKLPYFAGAQYSFDFVRLGNDRFVRRWIFNPYVTFVDNSWNITNFQYNLQVKDFFDDSAVVRREVRDAVNYMIGPTHFFLFDDGRHFIKLGYQYDFEDAEGENWSYWGNRLLLGFQYTLSCPQAYWKECFWKNVRLRYDLDLHWRFHKFRHSLLPTGRADKEHRRDREAVHFISLAKDFSTDFSRSFPFVSCDKGRCPFTITVDYLFDDNMSNIGPFDYRRHVVTTSLTWRFDSSTWGWKGWGFQNL